ncbi:nucleotidyl transferase AbiEii/AbiGii toxin family protein [Muricoccus aerilatus]|uniref:nucleotidyl transferase AbiEii/AbiGii toxin family protein n=1 Tax=Muricoccus aerilatus TaxID=452982 RepID=UPI0005C2310A|nr:nucleotidyl transferase AbiEii/AbiGii toxin family protein [Roseomonas aerilata]
MGVLARYAEEEILAALATSTYRTRFPVHGAWAMASWCGRFLRPTSGIDLLDMERSSPDQAVAHLGAAIGPMPRGLDVDWSRARVRTLSRRRSPLHTISLPTQLDAACFQVAINVMEARRPAPEIEFHPLPQEFRAGRRRWIASTNAEEMVAEKAALLVTYGPDHTRLKDICDLWLLSKHLRFNSDDLIEAMSATFAGRDAAKMILRRDGYWEAAFDPSIRGRTALFQWADLSHSMRSDVRPPSLRKTLQELAEFLFPLFKALRGERAAPGSWDRDGRWTLLSGCSSAPRRCPVIGGSRDEGSDEQGNEAAKFVSIGSLLQGEISRMAVKGAHKPK